MSVRRSFSTLAMFGRSVIIRNHIRTYNADMRHLVASQARVLRAMEMGSQNLSRDAARKIQDMRRQQLDSIDATLEARRAKMSAKSEKYLKHAAAHNSLLNKKWSTMPKENTLYGYIYEGDVANRLALTEVLHNNSGIAIKGKVGRKTSGFSLNDTDDMIRFANSMSKRTTNLKLIGRYSQDLISSTIIGTLTGLVLIGAVALFLKKKESILSWNSLHSDEDLEKWYKKYSNILDKYLVDDIYAAEYNSKIKFSLDPQVGDAIDQAFEIVAIPWLYQFGKIEGYRELKQAFRDLVSKLEVGGDDFSKLEAYKVMCYSFLVTADASNRNITSLKFLEASSVHGVYKGDLITRVNLTNSPLATKVLTINHSKRTVSYDLFQDVDEYGFPVEKWEWCLHAPFISANIVYCVSEALNVTYANDPQDSSELWELGTTGTIRRTGPVQLYEIKPKEHEPYGYSYRERKVLHTCDVCKEYYPLLQETQDLLKDVVAPVAIETAIFTVLGKATLLTGNPILIALGFGLPIAYGLSADWIKEIGTQIAEENAKEKYRQRLKDVKRK